MPALNSSLADLLSLASGVQGESALVPSAYPSEGGGGLSDRPCPSYHVLAPVHVHSETRVNVPSSESQGGIRGRGTSGWVT